MSLLSDIKLAKENAAKVAELSTLNASLISERDALKLEVEALKADKATAEKAAEEALEANKLAEAAKVKAEADALAAKADAEKATADFSAKVEQAASLKALEITGKAGSPAPAKAEKQGDSKLTGIDRAIAAHKAAQISVK